MLESTREEASSVSLEMLATLNSMFSPTAFGPASVISAILFLGHIPSFPLSCSRRICRYHTYHLRHGAEPVQVAKTLS